MFESELSKYMFPGPPVLLYTEQRTSAKALSVCSLGTQNKLQMLKSSIKLNGIQTTLVLSLYGNQP